MKIESFDYSQSAKTKASFNRTTNKKEFANLITKANAAVENNQYDTESFEKDVSNKGKESKLAVGHSEPIEEQITDEVKKTQENKETNTPTSQFNVHLSNGLDILLGSVSNLADDSNRSKKISIEDLSSIINASSLQELGNTLGLSLEQIDTIEGLSLDNILSAIGTKKEDLQKAIQRLTGDQVKAKDVWSLLAGIDQNLPVFTQRIMSSIKNDSDSIISKSQASQVLQFLKIVELVGPKTDLMLSQEYQTFQVKELISTLSENVKQIQDTSNEVLSVKNRDLQPLSIKLVNHTTNENESKIQTTTKDTTKAVTLTLSAQETSNEDFVKNRDLQPLSSKLVKSTTNESESKIQTATKDITKAVTLTLPAQETSNEDLPVKNRDLQSLSSKLVEPMTNENESKIQTTTKDTTKAVTLTLPAQETSNEDFVKNRDLQPLSSKLVEPMNNENGNMIQSTRNDTTKTVTLTLPANKASQAEAFVKEFQTIMSRSQFGNNAAGTKLLIKLYPENLGSIRVELTQRDGIMTARFLASTNIGKQMLESQLQQLKQGLVNQNIQLDRIDVAQTLNETNRNEKQQQQPFQQAFKQHADDQQKQQKDEKEENSNFNDFLMELEV